MFDDVQTTDLQSVPSEYSPFNPLLDQAFPVDALFTKENAARALSQEMTGMGWVSLFSNSPAKNAEAEIMMGDVIKAALQAGQWVDIAVREDEPLGGNVEPTPELSVDFSNVMFQFGRGGKIMEDKRFVEKVIDDDDGGEWIKPTNKLVAFIWERTKQFSPRREAEK